MKPQQWPALQVLYQITSQAPRNMYDAEKFIPSLLLEREFQVPSYYCSDSDNFFEYQVMILPPVMVPHSFNAYPHSLLTHLRTRWLIFSIVFFISISFISALIFMISFLLVILGFVLSLVALNIRLGCLRFLFPTARLYRYKLPSENCFCCIPEVLGHQRFWFYSYVYVVICL